MSFLKINKTVDSIMSVFSKTISDLDAVHISSLEASDQKREEAAKMLQMANSHLGEAERAAAIASKLRGIVEA